MTSYLALVVIIGLLVSIAIISISIQKISARHLCPKPVGFFLIPVHTRSGEPAGCLPAKVIQDCNQFVGVFQRDCAYFFRDLAHGKLK